VFKGVSEEKVPLQLQDEESTDDAEPENYNFFDKLVGSTNREDN
jgi:hypothetical protein